MKKRFIFYTIAAMLIWVSTAAADNVIEFGLIKNIPPYSYMEEGAVKGIDWEIFSELKRRIKFQSHVKLLPFKRLWEYAQKGKIDVILQVYYRPVREEHIVYTSVPVRWSAHYIFVRKDRKKEFARSDLPALYGRIVGKDRGFFISEAFKMAADWGRFKVDEGGTTAANIQKLHRGRIDCFVSAYPVAMATARQLGLQGEIVRLDEPMIPKKGVFVGISKASVNISDKKAFAEQLSRQIELMHEDGTIQRIEKQFLQ